MTMYEVLISHLRDCAKYDTYENTFSEAADAIEKLEKSIPRWIPVTERLPDKFQSVFAACKSEGRENWTIDTVYDPFLECPWGRIPILEIGKAVVYAWMDNSAPDPPKEELE